MVMNWPPRATARAVGAAVTTDGQGLSAAAKVGVLAVHRLLKWLSGRAFRRRRQHCGAHDLLGPRLTPAAEVPERGVHDGVGVVVIRTSGEVRLLCWPRPLPTISGDWSSPADARCVEDIVRAANRPQIPIGAGQLPSALAPQRWSVGFLDQQGHRRRVTDGCPRHALELDDDDGVDPFEATKGDPAAWPVVGDDDITQAQVERGNGSNAVRHGGDSLRAMRKLLCCWGSVAEQVWLNHLEPGFLWAPSTAKFEQLPSRELMRLRTGRRSPSILPRRIVAM